MDEQFAPAIAALQKKLSGIEDEARAIKSSINTLCSVAGAPPMYVIEDESSASVITNIQADTFYGKTIGGAAREYLEMRRRANMGPASTREVFDALVKGGFQFDTANDNNAMISLGSTMRKNSKMFHKLPNGKYGLLSWYPNAKADTKSATDAKSVAEDESIDASNNDQEADASEPEEEGD